MRRWLTAAALVAACSAPARKQPDAPSAESAVERAFAASVERLLAGHFAFRPSFAVELGLHEYDGKVPDRSATAIGAEVQRLAAAEAELTAVDAAQLSRTRQLEREILLAEIRKERYELEVRKRPTRDPFFYLFKFSLNAYIARDYAPPATRAAAMLRACEAAPAYYQQAQTNLEPVVPKAWLQVGIMVSGGTIDFLSGDAKRAFAALPDEQLRTSLDACLDNLAKEVGRFRDSLKARMANGSDDFRLGADNLVAMLKATDGIEITIPRLERLARADLEKNLAAIAAAAKAIDPARDVATVVAEVSQDKPAPDQVIAEATAQLAQLRTFLVEKDIVSLPRADVIEVRESPPFMRGNFAALGGVGPFETAALPSFYYVAPPDPAWPVEQQRAYVMSRPDLLFTSAHEVYPGHFVQGMHQRASKSRVLAAFETYTASEGWAHYVEEMMWERGLGNGDPKIHIGQLKNALLRDVRFLVALGYHAGTLTPEQATKMFVEQAFADPNNARQQAMRGTVDPMFLGYTLGKLAIVELREDWLAKHPGKRLREFHDEFLRHGEAPLPVTRRMMLGASAGPPLAK